MEFVGRGYNDCIEISAVQTIGRSNCVHTEFLLKFLTVIKVCVGSKYIVPHFLQ